MSFFETTWGDLFSVAGVLVSAWTLRVATKAKEAAEAARAAARRQSLIDDLRDAQDKLGQVGVYLSRQNWEVVLLCAQQAMGACSQVLRRWGADTLTPKSRDNILRSQTHAALIAKEAVVAGAAPPDAPRLSRIASAQQKAFELLCSELAESMRRFEKG